MFNSPLPNMRANVQYYKTELRCVVIDVSLFGEGGMGKCVSGQVGGMQSVVAHYLHALSSLCSMMAATLTVHSITPVSCPRQLIHPTCSLPLVPTE